MAIHKVNIHRFHRKKLESISFQINLSGSSLNLTEISHRQRCSHSRYLWLVFPRLKDIIRGVFARTIETKTFLWCTILYKDGYYCARGNSPNQMYSQNLTVPPFPTLKYLLLKKSCFARIRPFQKGESVGLASTCTRVSLLRYLLCSSCCHISSLVNSLNNYLLSKHLFFNSNTSIRRPDNLYFLLFSSDCQKNLERQ
jgi:hypothetical protein